VRRISRFLPLGLAVAAGVAAVALHPEGPGAWSTRVYPAWTALIVPATERAPWPWTPLLASALAIVLAVSIVRGPRRVRTWTRVIGVALLVGSGFEASWGLHAARPSVESRLGLRPTSHPPGSPGPPGSPATSGELAELAQVALKLAEIVRRDAPVEGVDAPAAHAAVVRSLATFAPGVRLPVAPKVVPAGVLGPLGVAGVVSPWTLEAHVDGALPPWAQVATGAHEAAHLAGYESEAGAELVGLLAGIRADHPHARYASALRGWASLPASTRRATVLPPRAYADLGALQAAVATRWDAPARLLWSAYERWLLVRGQRDGLAGYAAGPRLLASAAEAGWW